LNKPKGKQVKTSPVPPEILEKLSPEILENLPPDVRAALKQGGVTVTSEVLMSMAMYRGPHMPAVMAAEYERYFPGWGTRMLELTEKQVSHRQELERKQVERSERRMDAGQLFSFIVAGLSVVGTVAIVVLGPATWYTAIAAVGLAVVGVGGPAVARIMATKFRWPSNKPENPKS
jgi:uncharacterized membrane protein